MASGKLFMSGTHIKPKYRDIEIYLPFTTELLYTHYTETRER